MDYIIFKFPTLEEITDANDTYDDIYEKCLEKGILTKAKMLQQLRIHKIFTQDMENELDVLGAKTIFKYPAVKELNDKKNTPEINKFMDKCLMEVIRGERKIRISDLILTEEVENKDLKEYRELSTIKNKYVKLSCEGIAETARNEKLLFYSTFRQDRTRLWKTWKDFKNSKNKMTTMILLFKCMDFLNGLSTTILRRLARHPIWRTKWITATKTGQNLFNGNISEWATNQIYLCYWSNLYDSCAQSYEKIEDFIISDDEMLDNFLEAKGKEREKGINNSEKSGDVSTFRTHVNPMKKKG